jgi:tripartite-type tricarboxylate transporter receptor subunit TctC
MLDRRSLLAGLAVSAVAAPRTKAAQPYPSRPVKIIVPFPPGTPSEFVIRALAELLSEKFKQPFVIENRPGGAGGTVGAAAVATAEPDGHTLLASPPGPLVTAKAIFKNLAYDPAMLVPVARLFESPTLLVVHPSLPVNSVEELVRHAKAHPRTIDFASPGFGTQPHLLGEMLKAAAGIEINHVPYSGPAAALRDVVAGHVKMCFETSTLIIPQAEAGTLRVLAAASEARIERLPAAPTMPESGYPHLTGGFWSGLVAPPATPAGIVAAINAAANEAMDSPKVSSALATLAARQRTGTPEQFRAFIAAETAKWGEVIRSAGIKAQ